MLQKKEHTTKQHGKSNENVEAAIKDKEEDQIKPIKHVLTTNFYNKHNKSTKNDKNSNRYDVFGEDIEI